MAEQYDLIAQEPDLTDDQVETREAFFTPSLVAHQVIEAAVRRVGLRGAKPPLHMVDPSCGGGIFAQALRRCTSTNSHMVAVDIEEGEQSNMERVADEVHVGSFLDFTPTKQRGEIDLSATNPPFSLFYEFLEHGLEIGERVWLYAPIDVKFRNQTYVRRFLDVQKYIHALLITAGPVGFTGRSGTDQRTYGLWMASREDSGQDFDTRVMPLLPTPARQWRGQRPGTFDYEVPEWMESMY